MGTMQKTAGTEGSMMGFPLTFAIRVFNDSQCFLVMDRGDPETGEQRWHAIGVIEKGLFVVVHVYREYINGEEIIRIFGAHEN